MISIQLPISCANKKKKKKTKKYLLTKLTINKEPCHLCKLKNYKEYYFKKFKIPKNNINEFIRELKRYEKNYFFKNDKNRKLVIFTIYLSFLNNLNPFMKERMKMTNNMILTHFDICISEKLTNRKLRLDEKIDIILENTIIPTYLFTKNPVSGVDELHEKNIRSFERLKKIQSMAIDDYIKLDKLENDKNV
jgi:hypothetical protein